MDVLMSILYEAFSMVVRVVECNESSDHLTTPEEGKQYCSVFSLIEPGI
jgi:hypothetical protein